MTTATVITKARQAYALWFKILENFPKVHRYNLGAKVEDKFLAVLENIFTAVSISGTQKMNALQIAIIKLDSLKFFLQLAWENKCINNTKYSELSEIINEIGKMLGGWKKGLEKQKPPK